MLIVRLSDPHVRPDGVLYQDVADSNAQFAAAIGQLHALDPRPNLRHGQVERLSAATSIASCCCAFRGTLLCTAPSTTTAIALQPRLDARPASRLAPPAVLLQHWRPSDGAITHFLTIGAFAGPSPFA